MGNTGLKCKAPEGRPCYTWNYDPIMQTCWTDWTAFRCQNL